MSKGVRWEYRAVKHDAVNKISDRDVLNRYGEEGWQLCAARTVSDGTLFYFKRILRKPQPKPLPAC
jgi:hypothetical protein